MKQWRLQIGWSSSLRGRVGSRVLCGSMENGRETFATLGSTPCGTSSRICCGKKSTGLSPNRRPSLELSPSHSIHARPHREQPNLRGQNESSDYPDAWAVAVEPAAAGSRGEGAVRG